jgi:ribose transport system ATP-binding protein
VSPMFRLEVRGLRKSFGNVEVLHGVDLDAVGGRTLALLGENGAGKSTTVKILAGDHTRDGGTVSVADQEVDLRSPRDAEALGIRAIFQEFLDAPQLSVAENICLGRLPRRGWRIDWRAVRRTARTVLDQLGVDLPVDRPVERLSVAERQIVEIARALVADARLLILDEPTSALAAEEVENLFRFVRRLRDDGVAIVYITHRLDEVAEIADDVVVFRDGRVVASGPVGEFGQHALVDAMVGQRVGAAIDELRREPPATPGDEPVLSVSGVRIAGHVDGVSLDAHAGEVLSLFGRLGCGTLELAEAMFGLRRFDAGTMSVAGRTGQPSSPWSAIRRGIGFLPVDRKTQGVLSGLSAGENIAVADWPRKARFGVLAPGASRAAFGRWRDELRIVAPQGAGQPIETLSGGNQQKIMLGRWLERDARILLLAEPTRGVDVGARAEIYRILAALAGRGVAIVVVSSDIEEVLRVSDRIAVFSRGRVADVLTRAEADRTRLTRAAAMKESS